MSSNENYARRVLEALASDPDRIALWREGEELTAGQFSTAVLTVAELLRRHFTEHTSPIAEHKDPVVAVLTVTNSPA
ncbi:amide synthetase, partial [Streptomyces sp. SID8361]|nr:amide synthetase [Streptomyces sp. SID8361]